MQTFHSSFSSIETYICIMHIFHKIRVVSVIWRTLGSKFGNLSAKEMNSCTNSNLLLINNVGKMKWLLAFSKPVHIWTEIEFLTSCYTGFYEERCSNPKFGPTKSLCFFITDIIEVFESTLYTNVYIIWIVYVFGYVFVDIFTDFFNKLVFFL